MKKCQIAALAACITITMTACQGANIERITDVQTETATLPPAETTAEPESSITAEFIFENIKAAYGDNFFALDSLTSQRLEDAYGISSVLYDEFAGASPLITIYPDIVIVIKAKADKKDEVVNALEAIRESQIKDTQQYPMNVAKVQSAQVVQNGDFAALIMAGKADERVDADESDRLKFAKEQSEIGVKAFNDSFIK